MSIIGLNSRMLSSAPTVSIESDQLVARASHLARYLSIGAYDKRVIVDRRRQLVGIKGRRWWFARSSRFIRFDGIDHIEYTCDDLGTDWTPSFRRADQIEWFTVAPVLAHSHERVKLFSFVGEGVVHTGPVGVILGDSVLDFGGMQEKDSLTYVELLMAFTGKRLV